MEYTRSADNLIAELNRLPGVGRKMAQRIALHILKLPREEAARLARMILEVQKKTGTCSQCFNLTESDPCRICSDDERDRGLLCVVEEAIDLAALERSGAYRGLYHVLGGSLSPLEGIGPEELRVKELMKRLRSGSFREAILGTNPSIEGEATALYLERLIREADVAVTRLARGIPVGGELEYLDAVTLAKAIENRRKI
jgi:recombination protein RecR